MNDYFVKSFDFPGNAVDLLTFFREKPYLFFLESSQFERDRGRFSFLGFSPFDIVHARGRQALQRVREPYQLYSSFSNSSLTPFACGVVGFIGYDYGVKQEKILRKAVDDLALPDVWFGFYDTVLTIDHLKKKLHITSCGLPEKTSQKRRQRAKKRVEQVSVLLEDFLSTPRSVEKEELFSPFLTQGKLKSNFSRKDYLQAVRRCLRHIELGDIYQVNLSQRFTFDASGKKPDPVVLYQRLRALSPSCFSSFLDCRDFQIMSSSPERFLKVQNREVETRPMKGTRPRADKIREDRKNRKELWVSSKEKAELLMITDLLRNDLGRVCEYGSVRVQELRAMEEYKTVFQTTSTVKGRLRPDKDIFDLIREGSPGGSITGCPKIRAMEIIEELEPTRRHIYTGSLGYISFSGNMDFNMLIRTFLQMKKKVYFQVGGGIVADSEPQKEYEETLVKAKAMMTSLSQDHPIFQEKVSKKNIEQKGLFTIFFNGKYIFADEQRLDSLKPGRLPIRGVFETMRAEGRRIYSFDLHWRRLQRGIKAFGISMVVSKKKVQDIISRLLRENRLRDSRVRLTIWRESGQTFMVVVCQPCQPIRSMKTLSGYKAVISRRQRQPSKYSHLKSLNYGVFADAYQEALQKGADEAILFNKRGELVEGSRSNLFLVKRDCLMTPLIKSGCLNGITRNQVLDLAKRMRLTVKKQKIRREELLTADEVFTTNSVSGIVSLTKIDQCVIGSGRPGPVTLRLARRYWEKIC